MKKLFLLFTVVFLILCMVPGAGYCGITVHGGLAVPTNQTIPYFENFNSSSLLPPGWSGSMEVLAQHGLSGTNGLSFNLYDDPAAQSCQATSPVIDLTTNPARLVFEYRIADWSNYPNNGTVLGPGDQIEVQISQDSGANFTTIFTINQANHLTSAGFFTRVVDLSLYAGDISIRFLSTWASGDYYVDIDDFLVEEIPSCAAPYGILVSGVTGTAFSLSWNGASVVELDYGTEGHPAGMGTVVPAISTNPYTLSGLTPLTTYDFYLRADCGSGIFSEWTGPYSVTTADEFALTLFPESIPGWTGFVSNQSKTKAGPGLNVSTALNDTSGRGYLKFNLGTLPSGALVTKAMLSYFNNYQQTPSGALNYIYPLSLDPVTATGQDLYTDCGDGPVLWSGIWSGTAPVAYHSDLGNEGVSYIAGQTGAGWAGFGIARSATGLFKFSGYDAGTDRPTLLLEYHIPTTPVLSVMPTFYDFQNAHVGYPSTPKEFVIRNAGAGILQIDTVMPDGMDSEHFLLTDAADYPVFLNAGESYTVTVIFKPLSVGLKLANLKLVTPTSEHLVPMSGTGYLNPPRNLTATALPGSSVGLNWLPPLAPGSQKTAGMTYTVYRGTLPGNPDILQGFVADTFFVDLTTLPATQYYYLVTSDYPGGSAPSEEVGIMTLPACPDPVSLTASNITTVSALLGWDAQGTTSWELEWGLAGFTQGTGTMVTAGVTNPWPLTGLTAGTGYSFYVRSVCGVGDYSDWSGPSTFTTLCVATAAPILEAFENATFPPQCWSLGSGSPAWTRSAQTSAFGVGTGSALAGFLNIAEPIPFDLLSLTFDASALYEPVLKFDYAYATYSGEVDSLLLYYSTSSGSSYQLLAGLAGGASGILNTGGSVTTAFIPTAGQWSTYTITLPPGTDKIRFTGVSAWGNNLYIDNVKIEAGQPPVPENLSVSGVVASGQNQCYNATQVITVAGNNTTFQVQSGGSTTQIAGMKITYLPGTRVFSGGYLHGYIAPNGPWCTVTPETGDQLAMAVEPGQTSSLDREFILYPNPAGESFTVKDNTHGNYDSLTLEIYDLSGKRVIVEQLSGATNNKVDIRDLHTGLYLVKIISKERTENIRLIVAR